MSTIEVNKCALCGKLFHSLGTKICASCSEIADQGFVQVRQYLYDNKEKVNLNDILQNTDVSEKIVKYLIKEGRISPKDIADGNGMKCVACGAVIDSGKLCSKCAAVWSEKINGNEGRLTKPGKSKSGSVMYTRHSY